MPRCKNPNCKDKFKPRIFLQKFCLEKEECIKMAVEQKKEKIINDKVAKMKKNLETKGDYEQLLQRVFNTFIRERDKDLPCISCGCDMRNRKGDASHYYPTTYSYLRFNEDNVHLSCVTCNQHKHGNLQEYRPRLIKKIGLSKVLSLDNHRHVKLDLSIPEIQEMIKEYKFKIKELKK